LNGLLNFLETEIHEFESVLFDYNLKILIRRYYQEKELRIDESTNEILFSLISRIKREVIKVDQKRVERNLKKQQNEYVRQMIEDYLRRENQAKRTYHIIELLKSNYIEIETYKLLSQMNKWTQTFSRVGNGLWGLTEWLESKNTKGSIREIVEKLLAQHNNPLHISEIISFLKEFRPITEHSLLSNIKVSENIHFQLFNCSFIGLRNKDYDNYWFKIPRFKASDLRSILKNNKLNYEEQINALINKGYPRIHCEYILQKRYKISE
jgi:hypothetical protein